MGRLNAFLRESRTLLHVVKSLLVILGNESCDLDSAVSAITLAYFYKNSSAEHHQKHILPVLNIPRIDLPLKTEVVHFLNKTGIELENLVCRDEIDLDALARERRLELVLVDHHVNPLKEAVTGVFDHRPLDSSAGLAATCELNIDPVGSCATLIAEEAMKGNNLVSDEGMRESLQLLYGTIVLDTVNLSREADKAREKDVVVLHRIERLLGVEEPESCRQELFEELVRARSDVSSLDSYQILFKDMKRISNGTKMVALPGYPILVADYIRKAKAEENLRRFAEKTNCDVILLIGMRVHETDKRVERDLGVINIRDDKLFDEINKVLTTSSDPDLNLERRETDFLPGAATFYRQRNIKASRKQILPLVKRILEEF